jgi:hypothetical protein
MARTAFVTGALSLALAAGALLTACESGTHGVAPTTRSTSSASLAVVTGHTDEDPALSSIDTACPIVGIHSSRFFVMTTTRRLCAYARLRLPFLGFQHPRPRLLGWSCESSAVPDGSGGSQHVGVCMRRDDGFTWAEFPSAGGPSAERS